MSENVSTQADAELAVEVRGLTKSYDEKSVLDGIDLTVRAGEFVTILGESGGGKSTLLKSINGLITPDSGSVRVFGQPVAGPTPPEDDLVALRRSIGYAVQGSVLFPHLTVAQNVGFVPSLAGASREQVDEAVQRALRVVGLPEDLQGRMPSELSGGQAQRVGIARAIAGRPRLLLMDEPFGAVDGITRRGLQAELARIASEQQLTIMFVTHDIAEALQLGDRVLILSARGIEQFDTPDAVRCNPATDYVKQLVNP